MPSTPPLRTPWGDFPNVVAQTNASSLKNHSSYSAAKTGDLRAAWQVVSDLFKPGKIALPQPVDYIVPVSQLDVGNRWNALPFAFAQMLSDTLDVPIIPTVTQSNVVHHTGADAASRLAHQPRFSGPVDAGRRYLIVDDVVTFGSTIANLRGHIESQGGHVVAAASLANAIFASQLVPEREVLAAIRFRFSTDELSTLSHSTGFPVDLLTSREAYFVRNLSHELVPKLLHPAPGSRSFER